MTKRLYTKKGKTLKILEGNEKNLSIIAKELKSPRISLITWRDSKKVDMSKSLTHVPDKKKLDVVNVKPTINDRPLDNLKQEKFCLLYVSEEFFGNGVQSYIEAYDINLTKPGAYNTARANASRLLTNANVSQRINVLLEDGGLNDAFVDKQLLFLITQHFDFKSKLGAIKEYNRIRSRAKQNVNEIHDNIYTQTNEYIGVK
ncbi:MAG: terminase small subunit [Candidatus Babeliales bacterium]